MRGSFGRAGRAGRGDRAGAVRAAGAREGRLAVCAHYLPVAPRREAGRRADRRERLCRVRGRHPGQGRPAAGAVHGPGPGAAARRPGAVRRRDPRPGRGEPALRARRVHRVSSPRCTPATGPARRSTPAASCPATRAPSSATATRI